MSLPDWTGRCKRLAHRRAVGHRLDQPVRQVPRVRGHEPQPRDRRRAVGRAEPVDGPDELREIRASFAVLAPPDGSLGVDVPEPRLGREVVAVAVDVLAEQRHLAVAAGGQRAGLVDDLVERAAPLRPAAERDDAIGAGLVAAVDDREPGADRGPATDRAVRDGVGPCPDEVCRVRDRHAVDDGRGCRGRRPDRRLGGRDPEPIDELRLLVRPQEQVDRRVAAREAGTIRLPDRAAGHDHAQPGVRRLQAVEHALAPDDLRLGRLPDRAGVDDDEVGGVHRGRLRAAGGQEAAGHLLRVALVHLAAQRPDEERRQRADLGAELRQPLVGGRERVARAGRAGDRRRDVEDGQRSSGHAVAHGSACRPSAAGAPPPPPGQRPMADRSAVTRASGITSPACAPAYGPRSPW